MRIAMQLSLSESETFDPEDVTSPESMSFLFHISMWWKIFYGTARVVLGFVLLKLIGTPFNELLYSIMSHEVTNDSTDVVFQFVYQLIEDHSFTVTYFVATYLLFWGAIDIVFSILLLRHKLWAFPMSLVLMGSFILYEIYRVIHTKSLILLTLILLGLAILYLIYNEYQVLRKKQITS